MFLANVKRAGGVCAAVLVIASVAVYSAHAADNAAAQAPAVAAAPGTAGAAQAARVDDFLSTFGINGHVFNYDYAWVYNDAPGIVADAQYIGARLWRDGTDAANSPIQRDALTALANAGIKFALVPPNTGTKTPQKLVIADLIAKAHAIQALHTPGPVIAIEGANEPVNFPISYNGVVGGGDQPFDAVAAFQKDWYAALKADPIMGALPVWSATQVGAQTPNVGLQYIKVPEGGGGSTAKGGTVFADVYNVHSYPFYQNAVGWYDPGPNVHLKYPDQVDWSINTDYVNSYAHGYTGKTLAEINASPRVVTEFGLSTSQGGMDTATMGKNILTGYLDFYIKGYQAAFVYELYDQGDGWGIFTTTGKPRPAATYLHNFVTALADTGATAKTFQPGQLGYVLTGMPANARSKLFQRSDGTFLLVLWNHTTNFVYGTDKGAGPVTISPVTVGLTLTDGAATITVLDPTIGAAPVSTASGATSASIALSDHPEVVVITRP